jgi:ABC-type dipeptide/oligopeptide/nickel transport system permease subunit
MPTTPQPERTPDDATERGPQPDAERAITGIEAMRGEGVQESRGFWGDAVSQVVRRPGAIAGIAWIAVVAFFAAFAPVLASGHPAVMRTIDTRTAADAARTVRAFLAGPETPTEADLRRSIARELREHAPDLTPDDILAGVTLETRPDTASDTDDAPTAGTGADTADEPRNVLTEASVEAAIAAIANTEALDRTGDVAYTASPLLAQLTIADWLIMAWVVIAAIVLAVPMSMSRSRRLGWLLLAALQAGLASGGAIALRAWLQGVDPQTTVGRAANADWFPLGIALALSLVAAAVFMLAAAAAPLARRTIVLGLTAVATTLAIWGAWSPDLQTFQYEERIRAGQIEAVFTVVPFSHAQRFNDRNAQRLAPGNSTVSALAERLTMGLPLTGAIGEDGIAELAERFDQLPLPDDQIASARAAFLERFGNDPDAETIEIEEFLKQDLSRFGRVFRLGTDTLGQDVLAQLMHACRLSISIGLVSTGIAVVIGVSIGALMGYFGGKVDILLYRVVEIFMAIPVLFILIVAASVLPRNTYMMMLIFGCFTWHFAARYTRAEFLKLRNQDFVQAARSAGLPLRSVLFKHILPNGVTPVLVDSSFRIALAILFESIISFLGLGPSDQASWGRLLSDATGDAGDFKWWLAIFPGLLIFLTVFSYNLMGEALRDAIDPKLKKARV